MERTQIYMTEDQKKILSLLSEKTGESQSVLIRRALDEFLAKESKGRLQSQKEFWSSYAGSWEGEEDSRTFVETLRAGADSRLNRLYGSLAEPESSEYLSRAEELKRLYASEVNKLKSKTKSRKSKKKL